MQQTSTTRIVFGSAIHQGGVRGHVIRQKAGKGVTWLDVDDVNFRTLPPDTGVSIDLDAKAAQTLFEKLSQLYEAQSQGVAPGDQRYIVAKEHEALIVNGKTKARVIREPLDCGDSEEFWRALSARYSGLASRLASAKIQHDREQAFRQFNAALTRH